MTSANLFSEEAGLYAEQVLAQLDGRIVAIVMGEAVGKVASTIIDVSGKEANVLCAGSIDENRMLEVMK